jgi:hypothetical protein
MWHVTSITSERIPQSTPCVRATSRDSPREWRVCRRRRRPALVLAAAAAAAAQPGTSGDFNTCPQTKDQGGRSRSHSGSQPESLKVDIRSSGFAFIPYAAKQPHKFYSRKKERALSRHLEQRDERAFANVRLKLSTNESNGEHMGKIRERVKGS